MRKIIMFILLFTLSETKRTRLLVISCIPVLNSPIDTLQNFERLLNSQKSAETE